MLDPVAKSIAAGALDAAGSLPGWAMASAITSFATILAGVFTLASTRAR